MLASDVTRLLAEAVEIARRDGRSEAEVEDLATALRGLLPGAAPAARVTPYRDGPYLLRGAFELVDQDGRAIPTRRTTIALCRCGRSKMRPFCDGTHKLTGFQAESAAEGRSPGRG